MQDSKKQVSLNMPESLLVELDEISQIFGFTRTDLIIRSLNRDLHAALREEAAVLRDCKLGLERQFHEYSKGAYNAV